MHAPTRQELYQHWHYLRALPRNSLIKLLTGLLLAGGSLMIFAEMVEEILESEMHSIDNLVFQWLHAWDSGALAGAMYFITKLGSAPTVITLWVSVAGWLWFKRRNAHALLMLGIVSIGGLLLNVLLKAILQRPRPLIDPTLDAIGWSLPSGHAMSAAIFYGFVTYLLVRSRRKLPTKILVAIPMLSLVLLIGISRIYLQAHYFSDVIAGYAAGCCWLMTCILTLEFKPWYRKHFTPVEPEGHLPGDNSIPEEDTAESSKQPVA